MTVPMNGFRSSDHMSGLAPPRNRLGSRRESAMVPAESGPVEGGARCADAAPSRRVGAEEPCIDAVHVARAPLRAILRSPEVWGCVIPTDRPLADDAEKQPAEDLVDDDPGNGEPGLAAGEAIRANPP